MLAIVCSVGVFAAESNDSPPLESNDSPPLDWRFLDRYPKHYRALKLSPDLLPPVMDGLLDDEVCALLPLSEPSNLLSSHSLATF